MTVEKLIKHLKTLPQDKKVIMNYTDHTDWDYWCEVKKPLIKVENVYLENGKNGVDDKMTNCVVIKFVEL